MGQIVIEFHGHYSQLVGRRVLEWPIVSPVPLGSLLGELQERYPSLGKVFQPEANGVLSLSFSLVLVNGQFAGRDQRVADGDVVKILPPMQGG